MESNPTGAGIAPSLQAFHLLRAEQSARTVGAYADDWYPPSDLVRELDRAADAILRADALAEPGRSIRSYLGEHGIAVEPRSRRLTDEDRARLGPVDLMAEYAPRPARPVGPDWGHRAGCTGCHRRVAAAYTSTDDPRARWVDEEARIADVADRAARLVEAVREGLADRLPATAAELDRRPAVDLAALDSLEHVITDFALLAQRAEGATFEEIGRGLGVHHEVARRRVGRAAAAARGLLRSTSSRVCGPVDTGSRDRDLDSRGLGDPTTTSSDRTAA